MQNNLLNTNNIYALIGLDNNETLVIEESGEYKIKKIGYKYVNECCNKHISSLKGRIDGLKSIVRSNYKTPVIIDENCETILFYTRAYNSTQCCWFSLDKIINFIEVNNGLEITFINKKKIVINETFHVFNSQYLKALEYKALLMKNKELILV